MADTYTSRLRLTKPEIGANENTWGAIEHSVLDLIDDAIAGTITLTVASNVILSSTDGAADQSRAMAIRLQGSPSTDFTVTIPVGITKAYLIENGTGRTATIRYSTGTGAVVPDGETQMVFANGTDVLGLNATLSGVVAQATNALQLGGSVAADYPRLATVNAFTAGQRSVPVTLTDAAVVTPDCNASNIFRWTLAGNRTMGTPTNASDGFVMTVFLNQDAAGNRVMTWPAIFDFPEAVEGVLTTTALARDVLTAIYDGSAGRWNAALGMKALG